MTTLSVLPEATRNAVVALLGDKIRRISVSLDEVTVVVSAEHYLAASLALRAMDQVASLSN